MRVEVDAFSGRPNPSWDLSTLEADRLAKLITGLPPSGRPMAEGGLGYRGFVIHGSTSGEGVSAGEVRVYNGVVRVAEGGRVSDYEDRYALERWLEEEARRRGYGDIIDWGRGGGAP